MAKITVDQNMFIAVKTLIKCGSTLHEVSEHMKLGYSTVCRINKAETFEEYKQMIAAMGANIREYKAKKKAEQPVDKVEEAPKEEPKEPEKKAVQSVIMRPTHEMMMEIRRTNELLTLISAKLAFVVDQLT